MILLPQESLEQGVNSMRKVTESWRDVHIKDKSMVWNSDLVEGLELRNLFTCAEQTNVSAEAPPRGTCEAMYEVGQT